MATNDEIKDKHTGSTETKDGFVCETCGAKFRTDYELLAHQGNPVIYTQKDMDEARAAGRAEVQSGKLTEVGQSLYDRRKHIEVYTAKKIYEKLKDKMVVRYMNNDDGTVGDEGFYVSLTDVLKVIKLFEKVD